ncbi:MAG: response regulator [Candidatus Omnitrophica bacterium]|nr:response regulator [Candidatus Omnitrophota bacterium]
MARKVLIIEDSPLDAQVVKELLSQDGIEVSIASNGKDGIEMAKKIKPDLITLDLMLPDMNGMEVCAKLKKEEALHDSIVVILSIKDSPEDVTAAYHAGADDYIFKPPAPEFLAKKLRLYLGLR